MDQGSERPPTVRARAQDVARRAGVSQSAVSRALANLPGVSRETRARIVAIADELDYRPNALARGLITRRSGLLGIVVSGLGNPFLAEALDRLLRLLRDAGRQVMVFAAETGAEADAAAFELGRFRVDGCFVTSPHLPRPVAERFARLGPTVLLFTPQVPGLDAASSVAVGNRAAGAMVADHLAGRGHRRLAYLHGIAGAATDRDRFAGFAERLAALGLPPPATARGGFSYEGGAAAVAGLLALDARPTALFAANDLMAMGAVDAARHRLGLAVPGDLAVVGFDDAAPAAWPSYALTTVRQPVEAMLREGVRLMLDQCRDAAAPPRNLVLPPELVARATT
jgi:DNA-binding LacI/PurR family transcriptional regulator